MADDEYTYRDAERIPRARSGVMGRAVKERGEGELWR